MKKSQLLSLLICLIAHFSHRCFAQCNLVLPQQNFVIPATQGQCVATLTTNTPYFTGSIAACFSCWSVTDPNGTTTYNPVLPGVPQTYTSILDVGDHQLTWAGNLACNTPVADFIQTVSVVDTQPPFITCPVSISLSMPDADCEYEVDWTLPQFQPNTSDNCGAATVAGPPNKKKYPEGTHTEIFTATDQNGLSSTCSMTISIVSDENVKFAFCPPQIFQNSTTGVCGWVFPGNVNQTASSECGAVTYTHNIPSIFPIGQTVVTIVATDAVGSTATCVTTVTIADAEPPVLTCPNDLTIAANLPNCSAAAAFSPPIPILDNCNVDYTKVISDIQNGQILPAGTHPITFQYSSNGATGTCKFDLTVAKTNSLTALDRTICEGDSVVVGGQKFKQTGDFSVTLPNWIGCDSIISLKLKVNPSTTTTRDSMICFGQSAFLGGANQTKDGIYIDTIQSKITGCDSILITNLTCGPYFDIIGPATLCPGDTAILAVGKFVKYVWSSGQSTQTILITQPGTYSLTVTDAKGCTNTDQVNIISFCGTVEAAFEAKNRACTDFYIQFTDKSTGTLIQPDEWFWDFGNGNFSSEKNPYTFYAEPGTYKVRLIASNGPVSDTTEQEILIYPKIAISFNYAAPDKCLPKEIQFSANPDTAVFPIKNWQWSFGDGKFSTLQNPKHTFSDFDTLTTTLVAHDEFGCTDSLNWQVKILPNNFSPAPFDLQVVLCPGEKFVLNGTTYDSDKLAGTEILKSFHGCDSVVNVQLSYISGGTINLGSDQTICETNPLTLDAGGGAKYLWSTGATTQKITISKSGTYAVTITSANGNCDATGKITVGVDTIPAITAEAGVAQTICSTEKFAQLNAQNPAVGTGLWSVLGGSTAQVDNFNGAKSFVSNLKIGENLFVWTLSNGVCKFYDADTAVITAVTTISETADAGNDLAFCVAGGDLKLNATAATTVGITGFWTQPSGQNLIIADPNDPKTAVSGLSNTGIYRLIWHLSNGVCPDATDDVQISRSPDVLNAANAGDNAVLCGGNQTSLDGNEPEGSAGVWSVVDGATSSAKIVDPTDPFTTVSDLPVGKTLIVWTLSSPTCPDYSSDVVEIFQSAGLKAVDNPYLYSGEATRKLNFLTNDEYPSLDEITVEVLKYPDNATLKPLAKDVFEFSFGQNTPRNLYFDYEICLNACPKACDTATVSILTTADQPAMEPPKNVISPNGDNNNDFFKIPNYDVLSKNIYLTVFNRWGHVVFSTEDKSDPHYDNRWQGTDNNGNDLPAGTYLYVLRGGGGDGKEVGYVTILRN